MRAWIFFTRFSCVRGFIFHAFFMRAWIFFHAFFIRVSRVCGFCVDFFFTPLVVPF